MSRKTLNRWTWFFVAMLALFVLLASCGIIEVNAAEPAPTREPTCAVTVTGAETEAGEFWAQVAAIAVFLLAIVGLVALYMERRSR